MMKPFQIWLPFLNSRLSDGIMLDDARRAFDEWNGDDTIWLLPELDRTTRWLEEPGKRVVAIPAAHLERVDVFHVGANGYVSGPEAGARFPAGRTNGLLEAWLHVKASDIEYSPAPKSIGLEVPRISGSEIAYFTEELQRLPYGMVPITGMDTETRSVRGTWPHPSQGFSTKSPDAESQRLFGPFALMEDDGVPVGVNASANHRTLPLQAKWPALLGPLIRPADGLDIMLGQQEMAAIARQSVEDSKGAQLEAVRRAAAHIFAGHTTEENTWFRSILLAEGEEGALFEAEIRGFEASTLSELTNNAAFRERMSTRVAIQKGLGPTRALLDAPGGAS